MGFIWGVLGIPPPRGRVGGHPCWGGVGGWGPLEVRSRPPERAFVFVGLARDPPKTPPIILNKISVFFDPPRYGVFT